MNVAYHVRLWHTLPPGSPIARFPPPGLFVPAMRSIRLLAWLVLLAVTVMFAASIIHYRTGQAERDMERDASQPNPLLHQAARDELERQRRIASTQ